jgi:hypothetical protein
MRRLFAARVSFEATLERDGASAEVTEYMLIARRTVYWWSSKQPSQSSL